MAVYDSPVFEAHESVHVFHDDKTGLKAIIAVHSTARGPAAGGCRMWPYASEQAAMDDALNLSRAMSYKNAVADLELGGGKSVIIGDSRTQKTPELFEAFGRAVDRLGGAYWTAEDVGVSPADLACSRRTTQYVAGLEGTPASSGDPSPVTADGVYRGTRLVAQKVFGSDDLSGLTIAVQGVGHVGGYLCDHLAKAGAKLVITDVNEVNLKAVAERTGASIVAPEAIFDVACDIFAPCALGGAVNLQTLERIKARAIAGAANNQLGGPDVGQILFERGVLYAPDYVINGGGIINVAAEINALKSGGAYDAAWVETKLQRLMVTLDEVLTRSADEKRPPHGVAAEIAKARIQAALDQKAAA